MANYRESEEIKEIAEDLINKHHDHLINKNISYLFVDPTMKSKGNSVAGKAAKVSGKYKAISGYDFVIMISEGIFRAITPGERQALVDHQLTHFFVDENDKCSIIPHDFEGFHSVIKRNGYWEENLKRMKRNADQLSLFRDNSKEEPVKEEEELADADDVFDPSSFDEVNAL